MAKKAGKKKKAGVGKKGAARKTSTKTSNRTTARFALAAGHHRRMRIGVVKNGNAPPIHVGNDRPAEFLVYGDSIGTNPGRKTVTLRATGHNWQNPPDRIQNNGNDGLRIRAYCLSRRRTKKKAGTFGSDDLTVTISLDGQVETECTFPGVDYDA